MSDGQVRRQAMPGDVETANALSELGGAIPPLGLVLTSDWGAARAAAIEMSRDSLRKADKLLVEAAAEMGRG